jgi:hypothetical protein
MCSGVPANTTFLTWEYRWAAAEQVLRLSIWMLRP